MQTVLLCAILVAALTVLAIQYGVAKNQREEAKRQARLGEEIEKIISRNSSIDKHDWISWLQDNSIEKK